MTMGADGELVRKAGRAMRFRSPIVLGLAIAVIALVAIAAIVFLLTNDGDSNEPNATAAPTLSAATGQTVTDGICIATVPIEWVDTGNGRGLTTVGGRYQLFGGQAAGDAAWQQAVQLALDQAERHSDSQITQGDDFVRVAYANDTGLVYRGRYEGIYCDFSVTATGRALTDEEKAGFEAAVASLGPASPEQ
jgi:hypothetical protein